LSYLSSGDSRQAIRLFNQASSLSDSPSLGLNRAFAYYLRGQEEKAQGTLQELMPRKQTETFMTMFRKMQERVSTGESTLSEELLRAAGKLIAISPPIKNEGNARGTSGSSADRVTS
ncbi:MAG TPA: tetratricopeptide repeat protein, partial [Pseudodesulfovibrio sp.]|nr:tetratricopeptide repeat protein [Pseudodesulfovibrio sp.]